MRRPRESRSRERSRAVDPASGPTSLAFIVPILTALALRALCRETQVAGVCGPECRLLDSLPSQDRTIELDAEVWYLKGPRPYHFAFV
jgi:hypothetical protein